MSRSASSALPPGSGAEFGKIDSSARPKPFSTLIASRSGVNPGSLTASEVLRRRARPARRSESGTWPAPVSGLQHAHALFRRRPSFRRQRNSALRAGTRPRAPSWAPLTSKKICQRAHRRNCHAPARRASAACAPSRWSSCGCESSFKRVTAAKNGSLLAAQLVGQRALRAFFGALGLQGFAQSCDLAFQALQCVGGGLKAQVRLAALDAQRSPCSLRAWANPQHDSRSTSRSNDSQALFALRRTALRALPASVSSCIAWRRLLSSCRSALKTSSAAVRASQLARLHLLAKLPRLLPRLTQESCAAARALRQCRLTACASARARFRPRQCGFPTPPRVAQCCRVHAQWRARVRLPLRWRGPALRGSS